MLHVCAGAYKAHTIMRQEQTRKHFENI